MAREGLSEIAIGVSLPRRCATAAALHGARNLGLALSPTSCASLPHRLRALVLLAALLAEMGQMMDPAALHQTLEALHAYGESSNVPVANVGRVLVQLAHLDGPLKLVAPPTASDPQTFSQHLLALSSQLNTLHDPKTLGGYMNSPLFRRAKYELFALQHMQLLAWLQRVQTALIQGVNSARQGQELSAYMLQLSHAARSMVFQPALLHALQVVQFVTNLPKEEVPASMRHAMQYPADSASDADRVEWLQLNLLLQFQSIYKDALCSPAIYQMQYTPGEASLFQGFLRLEEIYTHLIGRFPQCCPLSEQEQAVLTQLCQKLNKFFTDGKQIKALLDAQGALGKQTLVQNRIGGAASVQYAVRDWIVPFMIQFTDLLKVLWTLWSQLKKKCARPPLLLTPTHPSPRALFLPPPLPAHHPRSALIASQVAPPRGAASERRGDCPPSWPVHRRAARRGDRRPARARRARRQPRRHRGAARRRRRRKPRRLRGEPGRHWWRPWWRRHERSLGGGGGAAAGGGGGGDGGAAGGAAAGC